MTQIIDDLLISRGFESQDLKSINHRSALYTAIIIAGFSAVMSISLAFSAWV
jgi:hypothetical protein